jgi:hypothetical protein
MNEAYFMRVMVSLNLADIMTATRPTTPPNNQADPTDTTQESKLPDNSEPVTNTAELIE